MFANLAIVVFGALRVKVPAKDTTITFIKTVHATCMDGSTIGFVLQWRMKKKKFWDVEQYKGKLMPMLKLLAKIACGYAKKMNLDMDHPFSPAFWCDFGIFQT